MGSLTQSQDEVTPESQDSSTSSILGMASLLSDEASSEDGAGSDAVETTVGAMALGMGNLLGATASTAKAKVIYIF